MSFTDPIVISDDSSEEQENEKVYTLESDNEIDFEDDNESSDEYKGAAINIEQGHNTARWFKEVAPCFKIAPSSVPGGGDGVYSDADIAKDAAIGTYGGIVYFGKDNHPGGDYVLGVAADDGDDESFMYVDASDPKMSNWTRYLNDVQGTDKTPNVFFNQYGNVVTSRAITAGEELFVAYDGEREDGKPGENPYWDDTDQPAADPVKADDTPISQIDILKGRTRINLLHKLKKDGFKHGAKSRSRKR